MTFHQRVGLGIVIGAFAGGVVAGMLIRGALAEPVDVGVTQFHQDTSNPMIVSPAKVDYRGQCWVQHADGTSKGWSAREDGICYSVDEPK